MAVFDLVLSVKRGVWRRDDRQSETADRAFQAARPKVIARDRSRCICGFQSEIQDVHHIDDDHTNNQLENLVTACPLCHGVRHIGQVGVSGEGRILYLPELSQEDINHLQRTCFIVLEIGDASQKAKATEILRRLTARGKVVEASPWGTSQPLDFAAALNRIGEEEYEKRALTLDGLRLVYHPKRFVRYMPSWVKGLAAMPMKTWLSMYQGAIKRKEGA